MGQVDHASMPAFIHAVGGSLGSALALVLLYPLERVKIELQTGQDVVDASSPPKNVDLQRNQVDSKTNLPIFEGTVHEEGDSDDSSPWNYVQAQQEHEEIEEATPTLSTTHTAPKSSHLVSRTEAKSFLNCLNELRQRNELYRGVKPIVSTLATSQFVFFYVNQWMKQIWKAEQSQARLLAALVCAGITNVLTTNPLWVTNLRIVSLRQENKNLWTELWHIYRTEGWRPLWSGTRSSILLVSNPVIQFFLYDQLRRPQQGAIRAFWSGALAKAIATLATYPLQLTQAVMRVHRQKYKGLSDCMFQIYRKGGIPELYRGIRAKLLQSVLTAAFTFLTYEQISRQLHAAYMLALQASRPPVYKIER